MDLFKTLFPGKHSSPPRKDPLQKLMENDFNVMFLPLFGLWEGEGSFLLKIPFGGAYLCRREADARQGFDLRRCRVQVKAGGCALIEVAGLGSFFFTNHRRSDLFQGLQRAFPQVRSFVFCGNETGGYFKILEQGHIRRKIASHLVMEGIGNNPETRGEPCEYERETGHIYRIDGKAQQMKDMLPDFGKAQVWALFDYYVGWENFRAEAVQSVRFYHLDTA